MKYDKKQIMLVAHRLHRETGLNYSECLKRAWALSKMPMMVAEKPAVSVPQYSLIGGYSLVSAMSTPVTVQIPAQFSWI